MVPPVVLSRKWLAASASLVVLALAVPAQAQSAQTPSAPAPDAQEARIEQLEAKVRDLAGEVKALKAAQATQAGAPRTQALAADEPETGQKPGAADAGTANDVNGTPSISSADGRFTANLHTVFNFDVADYDQAAPGPIASDLRRSGPALGATASNVDLTHARDLKDGDAFRRLRIGLDGTVYGDWDYRMIFDFAGTGVENAGNFYEGWIQYSGFRPLALRAGVFAPSIGLEDQGSTNGMPFLERAAVSDLARGVAAGEQRTGAAAFANGDHWLASVAITGRVVGSLSTGTASTTPQTFADQLGFVGRVAGTPLSGDDWLVHLGVHGSYVARPADVTGPAANGTTPLNAEVIGLSVTPELRVDGTKLISTGNIDARHAATEGVELAAQKGPLFVESEYEYFDVARSDPGLSDPHFHGWYVEGTWMLTGERRRYNSATAAFDAPPVPHPFDLTRGDWGAWEIGLRYSDLDLNYRPGEPGTAPLPDAIRGGEEQNWTAGLNWYLNSVVRVMVDWQHVRIDRLSPNATLFQTPTGAQIGQGYNVLALRTQFAF